MDNLSINNNYLNNVTSESEFFNMLDEYNEEEKNIIKKAYDYANQKHKGQVRESGEEYITHPTAVASILVMMHADVDTVVAGLLHDTIEDTNATYEEVENLFGSDVAVLVDGVTKLSKLNFSTKEEREDANTRKIILGITKDIRIIIIKLADRLHNMRTLEHKNEFKQKENAIETMEIFVPLAYAIGSYRIKSELEDLSFKYLRTDDYIKINDILESNHALFLEELNEMYHKIHKSLEDNGISNYGKLRTKNIYGIYKKIAGGMRLEDIHDLLSIKFRVDNVDNCYRSLRFVHNAYHPLNAEFKDYICNPKTNMYRSLHTTVFGPNDRLVQIQLRTYDMDKIASLGITAYWQIEGSDARQRMQDDLRKKYQFYKPLYEINSMFLDNKEFVSQVKTELFGKKVYVYTTKGDVIELPMGSTPIDLAYKLNTELGNHLYKAIVNDREVPLSTVLENRDRIKIVTSPEIEGPNREWIKLVKTTKAKSKINEFAKH